MMISNPVREFLPRPYWERAADYFSYSVEYNTLAASAVAQVASFNVDADSDFFCLSISRIIATTAAGTTEQTFGPFLIRVFDSGSGAAWMNLAIQIENFAGRMSVDGYGPHWLEVPRLIKASSTVSVEVTNLEATARRLWLTFHGQKIFNRIRALS